jgi:hypothetical protein
MLVSLDARERARVANKIEIECTPAFSPRYQLSGDFSSDTSLPSSSHLYHSKHNITGYLIAF